jgi:sugar/nucleoside kinase (ribokinase family)
MAGHRDPNLRGTVVVVGGMNTDVVGRSSAPLLARDSDPGWTSVSSGGVSRNTAENRVHTGVDVELITALGGDHNALALSTASHQRRPRTQGSAQRTCGG